jgi:hypothetical protein
MPARKLRDFGKPLRFIKLGGTLAILGPEISNIDLASVSFRRPSTFVLFPHGSDLAEVIRPALCGFGAALFAHRCCGIDGQEMISQVNGGSQQLVSPFGSGLRQFGCGEDVLRF